jgi:hypothetical protein
MTTSAHLGLWESGRAGAYSVTHPRKKVRVTNERVNPILFLGYRPVHVRY